MVDYAALGIVDSADKQKLFRLIKNLNAEGAFKTDATVDATPAHPAAPAPPLPAPACGCWRRLARLNMYEGLPGSRASARW